MSASVALFVAAMFMVSGGVFAAADASKLQAQPDISGKPADQMEEQAPPEEQLSRLADIRVNTVEELHTLLERVNLLLSESAADDSEIQPVIFLLHGAEAKTFFRQNYAQHKSTVDLAARLSAFNAVDIKVCERWASNKKLDVRRLQPFVGTVPFAPAEENRLLKQGYKYF